MLTGSVEQLDGKKCSQESTPLDALLHARYFIMILFPR